MKNGKPYIVSVLEALYHFSNKQEVITTDEIFQWITPKIKMKQIYSAISNYKTQDFQLLETVGLGRCKLNREKIDEVYNEHLDRSINLWAKSKDNKKRFFLKSNTGRYRGYIIICALFAAYHKDLTINDMAELAEQNGLSLNQSYLRYAIKKDHHSCAIPISEKAFGKSVLYREDKQEIKKLGADLLKKVLPKKADAIEQWFKIESSAEIDWAPALDESLDIVKPEPITPEFIADQAPEIQENEIAAIDAAQVGAAILAYVRKLQRKQNKSDIGKQQAKIEDQVQTIINLQNTVLGLEGQLSKLQKMYESQNQKLIDLNHCLEVEKKKNEDLKPSISGTFKVADVARITRVVKNI